MLARRRRRLGSARRCASAPSDASLAQRRGAPTGPPPTISTSSTSSAVRSCSSTPRGRARDAASGPAKPGADARERALCRRREIEQQQAEVARESHAGPRIAEQLDESIRESDDAAAIARRARLEARQQLARQRPRSAAATAATSTSASIAASRRPRLNPCPATGCSACAALPMSTARVATSWSQRA